MSICDRFKRKSEIAIRNFPHCCVGSPGISPVFLRLVVKKLNAGQKPAIASKMLAFP
jgi:hypothetical protein